MSRAFTDNPSANFGVHGEVVSHCGAEICEFLHHIQLVVVYDGGWQHVAPRELSRQHHLRTACVS